LYCTGVCIEVLKVKVRASSPESVEKRASQLARSGESAKRKWMAYLQYGSTFPLAVGSRLWLYTFGKNMTWKSCKAT
jgi:hypothetical protein